MADSKESFETLENASGDGVAATASQIGEASAAKIGMTVFPFRDSSGNLRMAEVNASNVLKSDVTESAIIGATNETAPATDTASSGLNGRLQRIAQRLTSLIGLLPTSLGQKTMANSFAVAIASDQSGIPSVRGSITATSGTAAAASAQALAANANRNYLLIQNHSTRTMWFAFGVAATTAKPSFELLPNTSFEMNGTFISTQAINVIRQGSADVDFTIAEG